MWFLATFLSCKLVKRADASKKPIFEKGKGVVIVIQGAFRVKPTPKVRRALSFCAPDIFGVREATKILEYSNSDDFRKLSVLAQIRSFL